MSCPKCGYPLDEPNTPCPQCATGAGASKPKTAVTVAICAAVIIVGLAVGVYLSRGSGPAPDQLAAGAPTEFQPLDSPGTTGDVQRTAETALSAVATRATDASKQEQRISAVERLEVAAIMFRNDVGRQPQSVEDLLTRPAWAGREWQGPYLAADFMATDPFTGKPYQFSDGLVVAP